MDLDYEKDLLLLLKLLAYDYASLEYQIPFIKKGKIISEPWMEFYIGTDTLEEIGLSMYRAEKLFYGVCRKQGLHPQDFMIEEVVEDEVGDPYLAFLIKKSKDEKSILIPCVVEIADIIKNIENNITQSKNPEFIEKVFDSKNRLTLDGRGGEFTYNKKIGRFKVKSIPFKILRTLLKSKDCSATYEELTSVIWPNKKYSKLDNKPLADGLYSLKEILGILPKDENSNSDFFKNIAQTGYRLELSK